jgi:hypothetical protein
MPGRAEPARNGSRAHTEKAAPVIRTCPFPGPNMAPAETLDRCLAGGGRTRGTPRSAPRPMRTPVGRPLCLSCPMIPMPHMAQYYVGSARFVLAVNLPDSVLGKIGRSRRQESPCLHLPHRTHLRPFGGASASLTKKKPCSHLPNRTRPRPFGGVHASLPRVRSGYRSWR